jgi:hypothetical protein
VKSSGSFCLAAVLVTLAVLAGCAPRAARKAGPALRLLVTGSYDDSVMLRCAALARSERQRGECLWLVAGTGLQGGVAEKVTDGSAAADRLDALGVDACLFGPAWLQFGPERARVLADRAGCFLLCANITDTLRATIGQTLMVRRTAIGLVGVCGVWPDSTDPLLAQAGLRVQRADLAAASVLPILRQRTDLCLLLSAVPAESAPAGWDGVLECAPDSLELLEVSLVGGAPVVRRVAFDPGVMTPDSATVVALDRFNGAGERAVRADGPTLGAAAFGRELAGDFLADNRADCLLSAGRLWSGGDVTGAVTVGQVVTGLSEPGRWAATSLSWTELNRFAVGQSLTVTPRAGRLPSRKGTSRAWRVLFPVRLAAAMLSEAGAPYELTARPLWTTAEERLESGAKSK